MDILELIDGAIEDWETSGDAMRWAPDVDLNQSQFTGLLAFDVDAAVRRAGFRPRDDGPITATYEWTNARDYGCCDACGYLDEVTLWPEANGWQLHLISRLFDVPPEMLGWSWSVVT
jgi:hypothetical protein